MAAMAAATDDCFFMLPGNRKQSNHAALCSPESVLDLNSWDALKTTSNHDPPGHGHAAHPTLGNRKESDAHKTTNNDDAGLKWVLEFERDVLDMEMGSYKVALRLLTTLRTRRKLYPTKLTQNITQKCAPLLTLRTRR